MKINIPKITRILKVEINLSVLSFEIWSQNLSFLLKSKENFIIEQKPLTLWSIKRFYFFGTPGIGSVNECTDSCTKLNRSKGLDKEKVNLKPLHCKIDFITFVDLKLKFVFMFAFRDVKL